MAEFGSALKMDKFEAQKMIEEAVANCTNLAEAMECVGAMYGIPSTNIMVDDDLRTVKIMNDTIMCPSNVGASNNMNTIIRSIGAVLDQISSRINEKLNHVQNDHIIKGRESEEVLTRSDPSKGKVVATYKDANGDMLLVYDSGIIDAPQTPAGRAKAMELRAIGNAPAINPLPKTEPVYFTDDDDVMNGVDTEPEQSMVEYSLSDMIGEDNYFIDAMAKFYDTPNLGHAILTYHGYDCVQPTTNVVQEAASDDDTDSKKKKSGNHISPEDIKYMKFDNSEIHKAIECLNKARKDQEAIKHAEDIDVETFVRNKDYQEAIKHIENQFDCKLSIKWVHAGKNESEAYTHIYETEYRTKLTISKSKGFQMGGAPINIIIVEDGITKIISDKQDLFGQSFVSVILHEIFHNISGIMRYENAQFLASTTVAMEEAAATRDQKMRRLIIEKYINSLDAQCSGKLGRATKRLLTKRLLVMINAKSDTKMMNQVQDALDKDGEKNPVSGAANKHVQKTIKKAERAIKLLEKPEKRAKARGVVGLAVGGFSIVCSVLSAVLMRSSFGLGFAIAIGLTGMGLTGMGVAGLASVAKYKNIMKKYKDSKNLEEYYADLMSGMYQLPQRFFIGGLFPGSNKYSYNEVSQHNIDEWVKIEKSLYEHLEASHPSGSERTWAGVTMAKKILEDCKHLDKNVKNYLQWIVDNNDKILKSPVETDYNSHTFSPDEAKDLDKHLQDMIKTNKVTVTESVINELVDSTEFSTWLENGMIYTEDEIYFQEECELFDKCEYIIQEMELSRKALGYKDETLIKRIFAFVPRLIANCLEAMFRLVASDNRAFLDAFYRMITPDKVYKINFNIKDALDSLEQMETKVKEIDKYLSDCTDLSDYLDKIGNMTALKSNINDHTLNSVGDNFTRFDTFDIKLGEKKNHMINGKQLVDHIREIHRIGGRMTPVLRRLMNQIKRLNTKKFDEYKIDEFSPEQKQNLKKMMNLFRYMYTYYNTLNKWIIEFRREQASDKDIEEDLTKSVTPSLL